MRNNSEMLAALRGSKLDQRNLFDEMFEAVTNGEILSDGDVIIFEALKNALFTPDKIIVDIAANLNGTGGAAA